MDHDIIGFPSNGCIENQATPFSMIPSQKTQGPAPALLSPQVAVGKWGQWQESRTTGWSGGSEADVLSIQPISGCPCAWQACLGVHMVGIHMALAPEELQAIGTNH